MSELWAAVKKETNGRLDVTTFPNNQLGGDTAMLTQLRAGALHFMSLGGDVLQSVVPVAGILGVGFAFNDSPHAFTAFDGKLGTYVRNEVSVKGLYLFENIWENGMRNVTSSTKPITKIDDFANFKIRTPQAKLSLDLFKTLGASPTPINLSELYTSLQTHIVDGQENPLLNIENGRFFEVQKYLSLTNHMWSGYWLTTSTDVWKSLPPDIQAVVTKNAAVYARKQRAAVVALNNSLVGKLRSQGMNVNTPDRAPMRVHLGEFYKEKKAEYGTTAWDLLESYTGKLG